MQIIPNVSLDSVKPSKFYKKKNSRSISPLPKVNTGKSLQKKKKNKENLLERRKCQKYEYEPNLISDANDEFEQRILKWLEDNNIFMVQPDDKEHAYVQNNISNIFQKFDKNSMSSIMTSNSNSSSPNKVLSNSITNSPQLNIHNSPLLQKRRDISVSKCNSNTQTSAIKLEKISNLEWMENENSNSFDKILRKKSEENEKCNINDKIIKKRLEENDFFKLDNPDKL